MRLINADALLEELDKIGANHMIISYIKGKIINAPTVEREVPLTNIKYKTAMQCLNKISEFCPVDKNVNQLDESPENMIRLSFAEIGDTARCAIAAIIATEPTVQREATPAESLQAFENDVIEKCAKVAQDSELGYLAMKIRALKEVK